jgi:hypothetical protein
MTTIGTFGPPKQSSPWSAELNDEQIEEALRLWDFGMNTADIADRLFRKEAVVERALRLGRERRRKREEQGQ